MRVPATLALALVTGCAGSLYNHYAGPAVKPAAEVYECVKDQMKTLGYTRKQFNEQDRWYLAEKVTHEEVSSGLYKQTVHVLDTRVKQTAANPATLDIVARTFDVFATARGDDRQERKAAERVQADARTLGQACTQ